MKRLSVWIILIASIATTGAIATLIVLTAPAAAVAPARPDPAEVRAWIERSETLTATRFRYRDIVSFRSESFVLGFRTSATELLFSVDIVVEAGVTLTDGVEVEISADDATRVLVSLPAARILGVDAREESIDQYFSRDRFGDLNWLDVADEIEVAKQRNADDALARGILQRAESQTRLAMTSLLRAAGFSSIEVRFAPAPELRG